MDIEEERDSTIWVTLPTYNEKDNIVPLLKKLQNLKMDMNILVMDDDSPDGTANIVEEYQRDHQGIHLLLRKENRGRGIAGRDGFLYAIKRNPEWIVEMDVDGSHDPKYIPEMMETGIRENADLVMGSRYVEGGADLERGWIRKFISWASRKLIQILLKVKQQDPTSGFRLWRTETLKKIHIETCTSIGPEIEEETLVRSVRIHAKIIEIPIRFYERKSGESELTLLKLMKVFWKVIKLRKKL